MNRETESRYLKAKQIAKMFGVTGRTVKTWVQQGLVPYYKIGRSVFFAEKEIDRMMAKNRYLGPVRCPAMV